ncbi:MAG: peptide deformylase [Anaerolineae bacterium]
MQSGNRDMAIRQIITPENPVLRRKARKVTAFDRDLQALIDDMLETMRAAPGVGLAAPQVGVSQRVIVIDMPDDEEVYGPGAGETHIVVNPEIVKASRETVEGTEGCLSIPGYAGAVERAESVKVRGQDRHGKPVRIKAEGWLARVFQHEIDHLDGVLFIDRASAVWRVDEEVEDGPTPLAVTAEAAAKS